MIRKILRIIALVFCVMMLSVPLAFASNDSLVVVGAFDPGALDPIHARDVAADTVCMHIYDTLVRMDDGKTITPALAERWEALSPSQYKFYLRKGVKFHNGEEFKADDVKFTIDRCLSPAGVLTRSLTECIQNVEVLDEYTVIINLKSANASFLQWITHTPFCIVNRKAVETAGEKYLMNPVGTGAFRMVNWSKGDKVTLERFEEYWGTNPVFKTLVYRAVPEIANRTIELESGAADIALEVGRNDIHRVEENSNLKLVRQLQNAHIFIGFNASSAPFNNVKIRQAVWAALDIKGMYNAILSGVGSESIGVLPPTIQYAVPYQKTHIQDVELAKKLLEEAGVKDRLKIKIWVNDNKDRINLMTIAQNLLEEVGIDAEIQVLEWGAFLNGMTRGEHQMFIFGRSFPVPDPDLFLTSSFGSQHIEGINYCKFSNSEVDNLLEKARLELDPTKRAELYAEIQHRVEDLAGWIPIYTLEQIVGVRGSIQNFLVSPRGYHYFGNITFSN